jgi:radical SAM protein with 4Fe4S-binding SPASM domain
VQQVQSAIVNIEFINDHFLASTGKLSMEMQGSSQYFSFSPGVQYIAGVHLGAIYDLNCGDVFSLDLNGRRIVEQILKGVACERIPAALNNGVDHLEVASFVVKMEQLGVGRRTSSPTRYSQYRPELKNAPRLRKLWLEMTQACNLRCVHCYADAGTIASKKTASLQLQQWKTIIDEVVAYHPPWIQLIGGEPLLRGKPFIKELLEHIRSKGVEGLEVFTNGTLLDKKWADIFMGCEASVAFSIYSKDEDTHDRITGVPGSHRNLMGHIDMLIRNQVPVRPGFILMQENEAEEDETMEWLQQGFGESVPPPDVIRCTPESRCSRGVHFSRALWRRKLLTNACFSKVTHETFNRHRVGHSCLDGSLCIHHDGGVYPCVMDRTRRLGSVAEGTLGEIIEGKPVEDVWRQSMMKIETCNGCEFRFACLDCRPEVAGVDALLADKETPDYGVKNPCCGYDPYTGEWSEPEVLLDALTKASKSAVDSHDHRQQPST